MRATGTVGKACAAVIVLATLVALFGRVLAQYDPNLSDLSLAYVGPESGHPLGYDGQGRDLLSRLLAGAGSAMLGPLAVVALSVGAGTVLAVVAAWRKGATDAVVSSGLDIVFAFPGILLAILAATVFGPSLLAASMAISIAYTPYVARVLRSAALKERSQLYISALEVQGASGFSICWRHLLPNMRPLIVAQATIMFGWAMVDLAAVSYLGLGVQPPDPNWGVMIAENQAGILQSYPIPALAASVCIIAVVVAFNVLGERLFEAAEGR
ncbi:MAG: ABC transporter permease [Thermoleophilia bacterium]